MAFLSEILNESDGIPEELKKQASFCCSCRTEISNGGMWAMNREHLGICKKCAPILLDWYIDALLDSDIINESNDIENVIKLSNDIAVRYKRKKEKKVSGNKKHM